MGLSLVVDGCGCGAQNAVGVECVSSVCNSGNNGREKQRLTMTTDAKKNISGPKGSSDPF